LRRTGTLSKESLQINDVKRSLMPLLGLEVRLEGPNSNFRKDIRISGDDCYLMNSSNILQ
jgi:hypothetical protein